MSAAEPAAAPDLAGEPDWEPLTPFWKTIGTRSFVSSDESDRIRVRYYQGRDRVWARAWFGPGAEGPPGHTHGGAQAALMDEAMGMAALATGRVVVAARIEVDFRLMLPLNEVVTVELADGPADGVKVPVRATLRQADGRVACQATGLFVEVGADRVPSAGSAPSARPTG